MARVHLSMKCFSKQERNNVQVNNVKGLKLKYKNLLPIVSVFLLLCLFAQVVSHPVLSAAVQEPVTINGWYYEDVVTYAGNSGAILGDKITANNEKYEIMLVDEVVGNFVFLKNNPYLGIVILEDVVVEVTWNCASKYASCTLNGAGLYMLPQLVQDNGKTQSFNVIWITNVEAIPIFLNVAPYHDYFDHISDTDKTICSFPESMTDSRQLTREELGRLTCMPGFVTPEQVTIQKDVNGGQRHGYNPWAIRTLILVDEEAEAFYYDYCDTLYGPYSDFFKTWEYLEMWVDST
jgi:hypothetical protein